MCRFIETVRIQDGSPRNLEYHQKRCDRTSQWFSPELFPVDLEQALSGVTLPQKGRHKCRVLYSTVIEDIAITPYTPKRIGSLKIVENDTIDYRYKYADRSVFEKLLTLREGCDDVLIVRQGKVTDISYANVAFFLQGRWYTPSSVLLPGTMRQFLIDTGRIEECVITKKEIFRFEKLSIINAMLDLGEIALDCSRIRY